MDGAINSALEGICHPDDEIGNIRPGLAAAMQVKDTLKRNHESMTTDDSAPAGDEMPGWRDILLSVFQQLAKSAVIVVIVLVIAWFQVCPPRLVLSCDFAFVVISNIFQRL